MDQHAEVLEIQGPKQTHMNDFAKSCFDWIEALIPALIVVLILFTFLFRVITISGPSMEPNLVNDDKVLTFCLDRHLSRGDIVVVDE